MFRQMAITRWTLRCIPLIAILAAAPTYAQESFESVAGSWSGGGMMKPSDGPRERVKCKVDYAPKNNGQSVKLNLRCSSDAYKMDLSANVDQNGTDLSGNWFESQYREGGEDFWEKRQRRDRGESRERYDHGIVERTNQRKPPDVCDGIAGRLGFRDLG